MIQIILPWPAQPLWPNRKAHWSARSPAVKELRELASWLICEQQNINPGDTAHATRFVLSYTFCPSTNRAFDLDNALGAMKGATDGIADALCVNDRDFSFQIARGQVMEHGRVLAKLTWESACATGT